MLADIAVFDRTGALQVVVEVKGRPGASSEWAAGLRRNILAHGALAVPYFLIVLPDRVFAWGPAHKLSASEVSPDFEGETQALLSPYLDKVKEATERLSDSSLEAIVATWLDQLADGEVGTSPLESDWLVEGGLAAAVEGGRVEIGASV